MGHIILPWFHHACDMFSFFVYFVSRIVHAAYDVNAFHIPGKYYKLQYGGSCFAFPWFFIHGIRFTYPWVGGKRLMVPWAQAETF